MPFWNKSGSGQTWRNAFDCVVLHLWHEYAMKSNTAEAKKEKMGNLMYIPQACFFQHDHIDTRGLQAHERKA
jgi:hypothetical protein